AYIAQFGQQLEGTIAIIMTQCRAIMREKNTSHDRNEGGGIQADVAGADTDCRCTRRGGKLNSRGGLSGEWIREIACSTMVSATSCTGIATVVSGGQT